MSREGFRGKEMVCRGLIEASRGLGRKKVCCEEFDVWKL